MDEWWKNSYQINNSKFNIMECKIISKNFNELIQIKSNINNLSQVKYINTKKKQKHNYTKALGTRIDIVEASS